MIKQREEMSESNNRKSISNCTNRRFKARVIRPKSKSLIDKASDDSISITIASLKKPSRKSRSKTKKPKYLSLRLQLSPADKSKSQMPPLLTPSSTTATADAALLDLFPVHQEKPVEEKDNVLPPEHDAISRYFFTSTDGNATTLTGLLTAAGSEGAAAAKEDEDEEAASRYTWGTGGNSGSGEGSTAAVQSLVRTAMRNREREVSEVEKWVSISEVVEEERKRKGKSKEEEVSSRWCEGVDLWRGKCGDGGGVGLKLDYEDVLNAWSDKGRCSLYIGDGSQQVLLESPQPLPPQTVPEMGDDYFFFGGGANFGAVNGGLWTVPEITCNAQEESGREGGNNTKLGQREASVLRYKEKRQSRLFAKKIRYEVRKLNAEKRPRIKGRFVKRS